MSARHPGVDRQSHAHHSRWAQLQPGAAMGWRALFVDSAQDAQGASGSHAGTPVGARRPVGYNKAPPTPPGGEIVRDRNGNPSGLLLAQPNAALLYATLAKGPKLPEEYQKNSSRHFMREVNRLGVTGVIDAGGGLQNYPEDYRIIEELHAAGELTVRIAYNLFTQKPKEELEDFRNWASRVRPGQGDDF